MLKKIIESSKSIINILPRLLIILLFLAVLIRNIMEISNFGSSRAKLLSVSSKENNPSYDSLNLRYCNYGNMFSEKDTIDYNNYMLLNDLIIFSNSNIGRDLCTLGQYNILLRNITLQYKPQEYLDYYILNVFHNYSKKNANSKIKMIWGLLTPIERTRFINKYVLE